MPWISDLPDIRYSSNLKSPAIAVTECGRVATVIPDTNDTYHLILMCDEPITHGIVDVTVNIGGRTTGCCYSLGCVPGPRHPVQWEYPFGYGSTSNRINGWGLHDNSGRADDSAGIYSRGQKLAPSTKGYTSGDRVRMRIDIDRGDMQFWVNDVPCAELRGVEEIRANGIFLASTIFNKGATWSIVEQSAE
ncbi:hypothetical protein PAPYR_3479 [Paratrimastix pyriformis]|uniref:SPRY domain-containing protein n=1 Tax=Paratrimastix pyriformis TaxID=342808 RepID=A0ABQ8UUN5_9EUKA|nr:hypothetical protein PAPYR_3479 [Paratrimastix pyriformis]